MTAKIVTHVGRNELAPMSDDLIVTHVLRDGDAGLINGNRKVAKGQLWERVRVQPLNLNALTWSQIDRIGTVRYTLGTHSGRVDVRGPLASSFLNLSHFTASASGILRGEA